MFHNTDNGPIDPTVLNKGDTLRAPSCSLFIFNQFVWRKDLMLSEIGRGLYAVVPEKSTHHKGNDIDPGNVKPGDTIKCGTRLKARIQDRGLVMQEIASGIYFAVSFF